MRLNCKCHGASGSCSMRTCWTSLDSFRHVGSHLMNKYRRAKQVRAERMGRAHKPDHLRVMTNSPTATKPRQRELVYLEDSPNYCESSSVYGLPGTRGRQCSMHVHGTNHCDILCCGRGYNTRQVIVREKCNCTFLWCCEVQCDTCQHKLVEYTCK